MSGIDFHDALYHCREVRSHLEEVSQEQGGKRSESRACIQGLEKHLGLTYFQIVTALTDLERAIETQDAESMLEFENLIDAITDYLDRIINARETRNVARPGALVVKRLIAWRGSAGRLAQILCQID